MSYRYFGADRTHAAVDMRLLFWSSEGICLRSSVPPHLKIVFEQAERWNTISNLVAKMYKNSHFATQELTFRRFWVKEG